jgi:hypothetical protein
VGEVRVVVGEADAEQGAEQVEKPEGVAAQREQAEGERGGEERKRGGA